MRHGGLHLALAVATACSGGSEEVTDPDVQIGIETFEASTSAPSPCSVITLEWSVRGAEIVSIRQNEATLVSSFERKGSVESRAVCEPSTFVLTAKKGSASSSRSIDVLPAWVMPTISRLRAEPSRAVLDKPFQLHITTHAARTLRILRDGVELQSIEIPAESVLANVDTLVGVRAESATNSLTLLAMNSSYTATASLIVPAQDLRIDELSILPPAAFGTTRVTISWRAVAEETFLYYDHVTPLPGFPGTASGSFEVDLTPPTSVELVAMGGACQVSTQRPFNPPEEEREPNDDPPSATELASFIAVGSLDSPVDRDVYLLPFQYDWGLRIRTFAPSGRGCSVDTTMILSSSNGPGAAVGAELGRHHGGGDPSPQGGECLVADPSELSFLELLRGPYYLTLFSELGETGDYMLFVEPIVP